jgi:large subunit ribosomal protein L3
MPTRRKPRAGSLQYYPRKRAKRIYPRMNTYPSIDESKLDKPKLLAFAGYKAGMLQVVKRDTTKGSPTFGEDIVVPVTVFDCPAMIAVGVRAYKTTAHGLSIITEAWADKLPKGFELKRKSMNKKTRAKKSKGKKKAKEKAKERMSTSAHLANMKKEIGNISSFRLIVATQPKLAGFGKKTTDVFEIEIVGKTAEEKLAWVKEILGNEIKPSDVLREGELIDTIGITKGKGTTGPVKRFGITIQNRHAKGKRRHVGSLGQEEPGRVRWTVPMAGQMGFQKRTEHNKRVVKINDSPSAGKEVTPDSGFGGYGVVKGPYVVVEGSVPGPKKRLIFLRMAMRPRGAKYVLPEIKEIVK